jgi:hypothetical protein
MFLSVTLFVHYSAVLEVLQKEGVVSRRQATMATGRSGFGFRRFKKSWRAHATRAKALRLDLNWQSCAY